VRETLEAKIELNCCDRVNTPSPLFPMITEVTRDRIEARYQSIRYAVVSLRRRLVKICVTYANLQPLHIRPSAASISRQNGAITEHREQDKRSARVAKVGFSRGLRAIRIRTRRRGSRCFDHKLIWALSETILDLDRQRHRV
jgi:hypothetical protein